MSQQTPLYQQHVKLNAKIVDFSGWDMPLHYGSQIEEHHKVRQDAGMFDVSHMTVVDVQGEQAKDYLQYLLANDVAKLTQPGKALYSCMLNETGGVVDDLIAYYFSETDYRLVVNAGTRDKDIAWLQQHAENFNVTITERNDVSMIAVQGPHAIEKTKQVLPQHSAAISELKPFQAARADDWLIARTGYTGEDGLEIIVPVSEAETVWQALLAAGVAPCGLGARDTLRLEAGLNLYGSDMDEITSPLASNLAWTIAWQPEERNFIGRAALETEKQQGIKEKFVGLVMEQRGVLRRHQKVIVDNIGEGEITSGTFSPTLGFSVALARIPNCDAKEAVVEVRGKQVPVKVVKAGFVRKGKSLL